MTDTRTTSHPYDLAFKQGLSMASPRLIAPLINEMFHPDVPLDGNAYIRHLSNEFFSPDGKKEKITDSQVLVHNDIYHIECDSYEKDKIIVKMADYDLYSGLNYAKVSIRGSAIQKPYTISMPYSGVLFFRKPSDNDLTVKIKRSKVQMTYRIDTIVLADYTIEILIDKDLYFLVPFYLFNHEKDIEKYNTDKMCRKRVRKAMHKMVQAINKGLREDRFLIFDYGILTAMMKTVTEGLTKQNKAIGKELDEIMSERVLRIPGEEFYLQGKGDGIEEGIDIGEDRGKISVYYEDMKLSPEAIAKKMNKPLDMVLKVIQKLTEQKNS